MLAMERNVLAATAVALFVSILTSLGSARTILKFSKDGALEAIDFQNSLESIEIENSVDALEMFSAVFEEEEEELRSCSCKDRTCKCCKHITIKQIRMDDDFCVRLTYSSNQMITADVKVGNRIIVEVKIPTDRPKPFCFDVVPYIKTKVCLEVYNIKIESQALTGCVKITIKLIGQSILNFNLGCFRVKLPIEKLSKLTQEELVPQELAQKELAKEVLLYPIAM